MPRSQITESWKKAEAMVFHVQENLNADEYAVFLDMIDPLPEPQPEVKPAKKARKKSASKKSPRASSLEQQIQKRGRRAEVGDGDSTEDRCVYNFGPEDGPCEESADANIHHLRTHPYHHEFTTGKSAAPTASDQSSANGGAGGGTVSSGTETEGASNAVHAASGGAD